MTLFALALVAAGTASAGAAAPQKPGPAAATGATSLLAPLTSGPEVLLATKPASSVLREDVNLEARATGLPAAVASYEFQYERAESQPEDWKLIETTTANHVTFETNNEASPVEDGLYNLRVVVTTTEGGRYESELPDRLIANNSPVATLADPGTNLHERITLKAALPAKEQGLAAISSVSFQWAPSGSANWTTIEPGGIDVLNKTSATASFDTRAVADGSYDFRVVAAEEAGNTFASIPVRNRLVDNTPPSVSLTQPGAGSVVSGSVAISAQTSDAGSGVASVRFQARSRVGVSAWQDIGQATIPSQPNIYTHTLNTQSLQNGPYDFRAIAQDVSGNQATSAVVADVEVDNQSLAAPFSASIVGVVAPAEHIGFLGAVANSPEHEAWAYGFTAAPPAEMGGSRLPYEAQGEQLVLLRFTETGGWQIADVPREPQGRPFLLPADEVSSETGGRHVANQVHVGGAMTPSGEAWLWISEASTTKGQPPVVGLFHRAPGGHFDLDPEATQALGSLLGADAQDPGNLGVSLRLGESSEGVYGMLTAPGQAAQPGTNEKLAYGLLQQGKWTLATATPPPGPLNPEHEVSLKLGDVQGPGAGWGAFEADEPGLGLILGHFQEGKWIFAPTGLDALDLTGSVANARGSVEPTALKANGSAVWIEANVTLPGQGQEAAPVVARYDGSTDQVTNSWCTLPVVNHCGEPLDPNHPAAVPDAIFKGEDGEPVALALSENFVDTFAHGQWTSVAAPGYGHSPRGSGEALFSGPNEGWLAGATALGHWSAAGASSPLVSWPLPDRSTLTSVALPLGSPGEAGESGALAVGFGGTTLSYDPSAGWLIQPTPQRAHHSNLLGVAFAGSASAFAVGQGGVILHWDGTAWSEDPQSFSLTHSQLNAVAFAPSSGQGWAVGAGGTILHYDGNGWSVEQPPAQDSDVDITSVAAAGSEVFAIAGGNLITRAPSGRWQEVGSAQLPNSPAPTPGSLRLVAGLPDGGVAAAGRSIMLVRQGERDSFEYAAQPLQGVAVALAPFREANGKLRAYASVAPASDIGGFPAGDGELLRQTDDGWQDLSRAQYARNETTGDGAVKSDPVLAVATGPSGEHAWAVGGYDGTPDAAEQGTAEAPSSRPFGWQSASIWRYDIAGVVEPPALTPTTPNLPAQPGTVSFAFFTSPMCREECSAALDAQPDVNLTSAAKEIATYAAQPGGPAFAMLGGNAVGPLEGTAYQKGDGAVDFAHLPELLSPLSGTPTFAALGKFDYVPGRADETQPWAEAFAEAPPPFGSGTGASAVTPVSSGAPSGEVHRYYAFDAHQNEGTVRVIVLDNALGSLEKSAEGQRAWLEQQLAGANGAGVPIVVIAARPLRRADSGDGEEVASLLASAGVLAVFTTNGVSGPGNASELHELNQHYLIPENPPPGVAQVPEYEGASLGYQQTENNGVVWYFASINTQAREVQVSAIPLISSLSLKAVDGLSVERSQTLQFEAIGRRPAGTLATKANESKLFEGFDDYVEIPAPACSHGLPCVQPSYAFTSSEPLVGNFVVPSGPGSPFPKLSASGHPIASSTSGLFCAYNSGTTTVTITAGLFSSSQTVTVAAGGFGEPCGTVKKAGVEEAIKVKATTGHGAIKTAPAPSAPPPAALASISPALAIVPPLPAPAAPPHAAPTPKPAPRPVQPTPEPPSSVTEQVGPIPAILPAATPPVEPIPPGAGGYAQSPAKREEKARKHASQSAFSLRQTAYASRPSSPGGVDWFYGTVGLVALLALALSAKGLPSGPSPRPALLLDRSNQRARRRRGR
jgi:hypothetical protein